MHYLNINTTNEAVYADIIESQLRKLGILDMPLEFMTLQAPLNSDVNKLRTEAENLIANKGGVGICIEEDCPVYFGKGDIYYDHESVHLHFIVYIQDVKTIRGMKVEWKNTFNVSSDKYFHSIGVYDLDGLKKYLSKQVAYKRHYTPLIGVIEGEKEKVSPLPIHRPAYFEIEEEPYCTISYSTIKKAHKICASMYSRFFLVLRFFKQLKINIRAP